MTVHFIVQIGVQKNTFAVGCFGLLRESHGLPDIHYEQGGRKLILDGEALVNTKNEILPNFKNFTLQNPKKWGGPGLSGLPSSALPESSTNM